VFSLDNKDFSKNPYPYLKDLRLNDPIHLTADGVILLTRYNDVAKCLKVQSYPHQIKSFDNGIVHAILDIDPPNHTKLRRFVAPMFTHSAIQELSGSINMTIDKYISKALDKEEVDIVNDIALPITFDTLSSMLGINSNDYEQAKKWAVEIFSLMQPISNLENRKRGSENRKRGIKITKEFFIYMTNSIFSKNQIKDGSIISFLKNQEIDNVKLTPEELVSTMAIIYIAGFETTVNSITNSLYNLVGKEEEVYKITNNHYRDSEIADELLRHTTTIQMIIRKSLKDQVIKSKNDSKIIQKDQLIILHLGSANRDEDIFSNAENINIGRHNANRHLAFAAGAHYCLGATLARMQIEKIVKGFLSKVKNLELVEEPILRDNLSLRAYDHLYMRYNII